MPPSATAASTALALLLWLFASPSPAADIDLQTCIANFDVHRDKIIRTQDSRDMGAKYLNEIDLGSREECLRLCCETEECDVFVYEEKRAGGCYLFRCGPPEDFKCKFTHHANYSSAVLAINRHLPDLESEMRLTKHEQDLTRLRGPPAGAAATTAAASTTTAAAATTTASTAGSREVLPGEGGPDGGRKCSRNQFECRSTGDCIAIYNACDGVPQCADGSDEAPELGCPDGTTPRPPAPPPRPPAPVGRVVVPPSPEQHQQRDFARPQPYAPPQTEGWVPHQSNQMPQYVDKNSHIFNHKESGLQVPDGQETSPVQYSEMNGYPKAPGYYGEMYRPQVANWGPPGMTEDVPYLPGPYNPNPRIVPEVPLVQHPQIPEPNVREPPYKPLPPEHVVNYKSEQENPPHIQEKMAQDLKHTKQRPDKTEDTKKPKEKHSGNREKSQYPAMAAYKMEDGYEIQDGVAETPSGAILSLTLGLIITCVMAVLIGCRLRVVRRRMRKCGKSYAHDADYLVNGMYL